MVVTLLNQIENGFATGIKEMTNLEDNGNWPLAKEHKNGIFDFMLERLNEGSEELVKEQDLSNHCFSAIGTFLKKGRHQT